MAQRSCLGLWLLHPRPACTGLNCTGKGIAAFIAALLQDFSEWGQCQVLELASHHRPSGEQEVYDLMNILDDRLCHSNSAVAMATIKVFLHLTLSMPATHQQARCPLLHVLCWQAAPIASRLRLFSWFRLSRVMLFMSCACGLNDIPQRGCAQDVWASCQALHLVKHALSAICKGHAPSDIRFGSIFQRCCSSCNTALIYTGQMRRCWSE